MCEVVDSSVATVRAHVMHAKRGKTGSRLNDLVQSGMVGWLCNKKLN